MFKQLLREPNAVKRATNAPLYEYRLSLLRNLQKKHYQRSTLCNFSKMLIIVANAIYFYPQLYIFDDTEILKLAKQQKGSCKKLFLRTAKLLLKNMGRYQHSEVPLESCLERAINHFLFFKDSLSESTLEGYKKTLNKFGAFLYNHGISFIELDFDIIDQFILSLGNTRPISQRTQISRLINFFKFCEQEKLCNKPFSSSIIRPRIWKYDTIPSALPWVEIQKAREHIAAPRTALRNKAIILLFSTYGFRLNEVRNLCLTDIDWSNDIIHIFHTKTRCHGKYPLDISVGNAIVDYIQTERPKTNSRYLFLGCNAPYEQLSRTGMSTLVRRIFVKQCRELTSRKGPHAIRHAVAQHMIDSNLSFKIVGDQLGHSSSGSTTIYAKLNNQQLRKIAMPSIDNLFLPYSCRRIECPKSLKAIMLQTLEEIL